MKICIVGAGFAGLSAAKVLKAFGHTVTVFEKEADVGGVWSASRRYPGLTTQNVRSTYSLSDFPYPKDYPEWPSGEQVQRYMADYVRKFNLSGDIRLCTEVRAARQDAKGHWQVDVLRVDEPGASATAHDFDYLIVANGIFSQPMVPTYAGAEEFTASGGRICHTSEFKDLADAQGRHVLVVGYGK